jgi:hypothetical protein
MERAVHSPTEVLSRGPGKDESRLFSMESILTLQKLIFAGSPLSEVLTHIAQLIESQAEGMFCTIWLPDEDGKELYEANVVGLQDEQASYSPAWLRRKPVSDGIPSAVWQVRFEICRL